jgi:hypothetical protein
MTGSFLVSIITPIVAVIALACWLGMVLWADGQFPVKASLSLATFAATS